jgi:two-component system nitrate/nitrite response regulator NarL
VSGADDSAAPASIRVLLVDDQPLFRTAIATLIHSQPDLTVVGEAENGLRGVELAKELRPDLVVMDVEMPVMNGVEATRLSPSRRSTCSRRFGTAPMVTCSRTCAPINSST